MTLKNPPTATLRFKILLRPITLERCRRNSSQIYHRANLNNNNGKGSLEEDTLNTIGGDNASSSGGSELDDKHTKNSKTLDGEDKCNKDKGNKYGKDKDNVVSRDNEGKDDKAECWKWWGKDGGVNRVAG